AFQQDVQSNAERVDHLLVLGECLIQKSQPEDAEVLEEELQDLSCFCQEVFRRVFRFRRRLVSMRLVFENEWLSDRESDVESDGPLDGDVDSPLPALAPMHHSTPKKSPQRNKRLAGNLGATVDLEWDPSVDVGGSTSHDEEDSSYYSAITGVGQGEEPSRKCRNSRQTCRPLPRCSSQEDSSVQSVFLEESELYNCSLTDRRTKEVQNGHSREPPLWHLEEGESLQPSSLPPGKGTGRQTEPVGFDPERIESWLGQTRREKLGMRLETGQVAGAFGDIPLPAKGFQFPIESPRRGQEAEWRKPQQQIKKKFRAAPIPQAGQVSRQGQDNPKIPGLRVTGLNPLAPAEEKINQAELVQGLGVLEIICKRKQTDSCPGETAVTIEKGYELPRPLRASTQSQKLPRIPTVLNRLVLSTVGLLVLLLLASVCVLSLVDPSCLRTNGYTKSFHLVLKYINGPPPT
ncbi:UNVERIFIED_CONTAM: hypothetical protein K2H54_036258, partial [Gekko kuhli]